MKKISMLQKAFTIRFSIIICLIVIITAIVGGGILRISQGNSRVEKLESEKTVLMNAELAHNKWLMNLSDAVNYGIDFTGEKDPTKCTFGQFVYQDVEFQPDMQDFYNQVEPLHKKLHGLADQVLDLAKTDRNGAIKLLRGEVSETVKSLGGLLDAEASSRDAAVDAQYAAMNQQVIIIGVLAGVVILLFALIVGDIFVYIRRKVIKPLMNLQSEARKLSQGELDLTFDASTNNEIGDLGDVLNTSVGEIKKYVSAIAYGMSEFSKGNFACQCPIEFLGDFVVIRDSIESFRKRTNDALLQIEVSAEQVNTGSGHVASGAQSLAQGSAEQAASVEELTATAAAFSEQISNNAEYSQQMSLFGKRSGEVVKKSRAEMEQMVAAIRDIAETSEGIRNIIKTIDDIAFQTNILALNAAVEAARAGSAGKGFAVVADEVRNLAQKSADAAQNTNNLIESSLHQIKSGESMANKSYESFGEVADSAGKIVDMIEKIAETSQDQSALIGQITKELSQISSIILTNSATAEESAAASEELNSQADMMRELVQQFQLERGVTGQSTY